MLLSSLDWCFHKFPFVSLVLFELPRCRKPIGFPPGKSSVKLRQPSNAVRNFQIAVLQVIKIDDDRLWSHAVTLFKSLLFFCLMNN
jgi:hypothetical protein